MRTNLFAYVKWQSHLHAIALKLTELKQTGNPDPADEKGNFSQELMTNTTDLITKVWSALWREKRINQHNLKLLRSSVVPESKLDSTTRKAVKSNAPKIKTAMSQLFNASSPAKLDMEQMEVTMRAQHKKFLKQARAERKQIKEIKKQLLEFQKTFELLTGSPLILNKKLGSITAAHLLIEDFSPELMSVKQDVTKLLKREPVNRFTVLASLQALQHRVVILRALLQDESEDLQRTEASHHFGINLRKQLKLCTAQLAQQASQFEEDDDELPELIDNETLECEENDEKESHNTSNPLRETLQRFAENHPLASAEVAKQDDLSNKKLDDDAQADIAFIKPRLKVLDYALTELTKLAAQLKQLETMSQPTSSQRQFQSAPASSNSVKADAKTPAPQNR